MRFQGWNTLPQCCLQIFYCSQINLSNWSRVYGMISTRYSQDVLVDRKREQKCFGYSWVLIQARIPLNPFAVTSELKLSETKNSSILSLTDIKTPSTMRKPTATRIRSYKQKWLIDARLGRPLLVLYSYRCYNKFQSVQGALIIHVFSLAKYEIPSWFQHFMRTKRQ